ncbi:agamous-like mads-box protein agl62 [Phtheirospermum japonicum]|uniref:Agamous-like mads-box protein agl62 n=1 Tax=Phtheirospermum japonicum TaxID=374723 RepID=A0A830BZM6_9LAMI|nr:agamous-like mads-box protein agl62 [Phtheirospermum japonicum]
MDSSVQNNPSENPNNPSENPNNPSENPNNPPENIQQKKGKGRKKTPTARIENETRRQVTFSKRRTGLFKKACEIGTLCGAENAVIVNSPAGKLHSFGYPNVETVAHKFLNQADGPPSAGNAHDHQMLSAYSEELASVESQLAEERKLKKENRRIQKEIEEKEGVSSYLPDLDKLNPDQLGTLMKQVSGFKQDFDSKEPNATWWAQGSNPDAAGFPMDPNIFMATGTGYSSYPNQFDIGSGFTNNSNVVFPNNPGADNPNATFFTANANPGFVEPFNPMASNLGLPFQQYPPQVGGPNPMLPFNYGNPNDGALLYGGETGGTSAEAQRGRQGGNGRGRGFGHGHVRMP